MMRFAILFFYLIVFSATYGQQVRYDRMMVELDERHTMEQLARLGVETDHGDYRAGESFTSDFSEQEIRLIKKAGFRTQVLIRDVAGHYVRQNRPAAVQRDRRDLACVAPASYLSMSTPSNFSTGSMGGFFTYQEMLNHLDSMRARYPHLISARAPIDSYATIQNRPIYWLRISNRPDTSEAWRPQMFLNAVHHAREPGGLSSVIFYMWHLLENYDRSDLVKALLDNTELYVVPCVNPDGYIYNQSTNPNGGGMWRKNRRLNSGGFSYGVDLNRNYGYMWGYDNTGSSPTSSSATYRGTAPFSEPETKAMRLFCNQHRFRLALNYHTYSNLLIYPWGYRANFETADSLVFRAYGSFMTEVNGYLAGVGNTTVGYISNGVSDDWMYGEQTSKGLIYSFTPEAGATDYGFWPPASQVVNLCKENFDLILRAHKLLLAWLDVKPENKKVVFEKNFSLKIESVPLGLDTGGTFTVSVLDPFNQLVSVPSPLVMQQLPLASVRMDSFNIQLRSGITSGSTVRLLLQTENGWHIKTDTLSIIYFEGDTLYHNPCHTTTDFNLTGTWGVSTTAFTSSPGSLTDSPSGNYSSNRQSSAQLKDGIDLSGTQRALLTFDARWMMEKDKDYVVLEASDDGGTVWNPLCGLFTANGLIENNAPSPVYHGAQPSWIREAVSLNDYVGKTVHLRFRFSSNGSVQQDGYYFDELTVLAVSDTGFATTVISAKGSDDGSWKIIPNPSNGVVQITGIRPAQDGERITVINSVGEEVAQISTTGNLLHLGHLAPGLYYLSRLDASGLKSIRKFVLVQ